MNYKQPTTALIRITTALLLTATISSTAFADCDSDWDVYDAIRCEAVRFCREDAKKNMPPETDIEAFCSCYAKASTDLVSMRLMGMLSEKDLENGKAEAIKKCSK